MLNPCGKSMRRANLDSWGNNTMLHTLTVHIEKPIVSAEILDIVGSAPLSAVADGNGGRERISAPAGNGQITTQDAQAQNAALSQACQVLKNLIDKVNQFYDGLFSEHREAIAKLSVEIARKILVQKVQDGDYRIEDIVKEVLTSAGSHKDLVVHLNPKDFAECQKLQEGDGSGVFEGLELVADSNIGGAECLLESPKGTIESLIEGHLERVGKALENAE